MQILRESGTGADSLGTANGKLANSPAVWAIELTPYMGLRVDDGDQSEAA